MLILEIIRIYIMHVGSRVFYPTVDNSYPNMLLHEFDMLIMNLFQKNLIICVNQFQAFGVFENGTRQSPAL